MGSRNAEYGVRNLECRRAVFSGRQIQTSLMTRITAVSMEADPYIISKLTNQLIIRLQSIFKLFANPSSKPCDFGDISRYCIPRAVAVS